MIKLLIFGLLSVLPTTAVTYSSVNNEGSTSSCTQLTFGIGKCQYLGLPLEASLGSFGFTEGACSSADSCGFDTSSMESYSAATYGAFCSSVSDVTVNIYCDQPDIQDGDCDECVSRFAGAGGCECLMDNACDESTLVLEGCDFCGDAAKEYCGYTGDIVTDPVLPTSWFVFNMTFQNAAGSTGVEAYTAHDVQIKEVLSELLDCDVTDIHATLRAEASYGPFAIVKFEVSGKSERDVKLVVDDLFWLEFQIKLIFNQVEILNVDLADASWSRETCNPLCRSEQPHTAWSDEKGENVLLHTGPCVGVGACLLVGAEISGVQYPYECQVDPDYFTSESVCLDDTGIWCEEPCSESGQKAFSLIALFLLLILRLDL